jgi:lipopolysaccharide export system permease protein
MLGLYVVVDLFTNIDDFAQNHDGLLEILEHIGQYYGFRVMQIFDRLCEAIVLLAAMFTVAWMQRSNELLPQLSAGVSTRRVVRPVLFTASAFLLLGVINQELVIPHIAEYLMISRDDPDGEKVIVVQGTFDTNGVHVHGEVAQRRDQSVQDFSCVIPESIASNGIINLHAKQGRYIPGNGPRKGGWLLTSTEPAELESWTQTNVLEPIDPGTYFLYTKEVDFEAITRPRTWFLFASTARLSKELSKPDSTRLASMAVLFHMRLTRPILGMLLVFLGLSMILRDQNRNVFISAGLCLLMCGVFFAAQFACKGLGDYEYLSPALAAWLPVLFFGPLAFVLFDAIHT